MFFMPLGGDDAYHLQDNVSAYQSTILANFAVTGFAEVEIK